MLRTDIESLWDFALASKCKSFTSTNTLCLLTLLVLAFVVINFIYWAHPGGPAWGSHRWRRNASKHLWVNPIPGPKGLPIIGSMNLMSGLAHHKIAAMAVACRAKRLMSFSLGETRVIVTCNPQVAKEMLNSSEFADRPVKESAYRLMFNRAIGFAPYGVYWRTLRKIAATHLFCPKQIKASEGQRFEIANQMVQLIMRRARKGGDTSTSIRVRDVLKLASLNNMMSSVFGRSYSLLVLDSCNDDETHAEVEVEVEELRKLVDEGYELLGIFNWSDHLPWLADFDLQKVRFRCSQLVPKVNLFVSRIIDHHRNRRRCEPQAIQYPAQSHADFVDVLLNLQGPDKLSDSDMIAVLWEMIFRGTDTVAVLIEWVLARMVLHPDVQSRVQQELDGVIGSGGSRALTESDMTEMAYLSAVVKEVLRLHPPGPLLSWARLAIKDARVDGYEVPMGTTAMVNMWAITRDPDVWSDPLAFKPERFLKLKEEGCGCEVDAELSVLGSDLRLAPFGSGRRTCPGKTLGLTTVTFWVASLLHELEFRAADDGDDSGCLDMSEVLRLSCEMAKPLMVRVRPRRVGVA